MSEDVVEGNRKVPRRRFLAELAAGAAVLIAPFILPRVNNEPLKQKFKAKVVEVADRKEFLAHLRQTDILSPAIKDGDVFTFSIRTFVLHQTEDENLIYPKFAIFPGNSANSLNRMVMEKERMPYKLVPKIFKTDQGIEIVSWFTPLANPKDIKPISVSRSYSREVVFQYYSVSLSKDGKKVSDNPDVMYYFRSGYLSNTNNIQSLDNKDSSKQIQEGMPIPIPISFDVKQ